VYTYFYIFSFILQIENNFNYILSQTRQTVERAFALLKGRFRRLKYLDMSRIDLIPATILACCVLHNICLGDIDDEVENYIMEGSRETNTENNEECDQIENCYNEGITKRNYLATISFKFYFKEDKQVDYSSIYMCMCVYMCVYFFIKHICKYI